MPSGGTELLVLAMVASLIFRGVRLLRRRRASRETDLRVRAPAELNLELRERLRLHVAQADVSEEVRTRLDQRLDLLDHLSVGRRKRS